MCHRMRFLLISALLVVASPSLAQSDTASGIPTRLCWRGKPAPQCTTFWITELGVDASMSSTQTVVTEDFGGGNVYRYARRDFDSRFSWTVGPMFNTGQRTAIGVTLSLSPQDGGYRAAVEARRRWWKSDDLALDLSGGVLRVPIAPTSGHAFRDGYGVTAGVLVVGGDLININGRVDLLVSGGRVHAGTSAGLAGGSYVALVGTVALGLLILAVISSGPWD